MKELEVALGELACGADIHTCECMHIGMYIHMFYEYVYTHINISIHICSKYVDT